MDSARQEAFQKLREPCVELSSVGLKFRGHQASPSEVLKALRSVQNALNELAGKHALDEKLAEYAFFPLAHIFNESKRAPVNVLEVAVNCLKVLVAEGWKARLSPQMGKQLVILLTLIVGDAPGSSKEKVTVQTSSIELEIAGFDCLSAIFEALGGPVAERTVYHEIGTATVVDQTVYLLLEGIVSDRSDELCLSAARALQALYRRITDRIVLASIMPRTVSALTKVLKPTTQVRRSYKLIKTCLDILTDTLKAVLNDQVNSQLPEKTAQPEGADERLVLDQSWLKATTTQIKLALTQVIQLRRHERQEVQDGLLKLCIMVVEDCRTTLQESLPVLVETVVVLSRVDEDQVPNDAYSSLKHLATTYSAVLDSLKNSLHTWLTAFPRTMQSNDETTKQWAIKQIATAFQVLSEVQSDSDLLTNNLTSGLCDSVAVIVNQATNMPRSMNTDPAGNQSMDVIVPGNQSLTFSPVLLDHKSQQQTLIDLQNMIDRLNSSNSSNDITRLIVNRIHHEQGNAVIAPLWLAVSFLKGRTTFTSGFDEFISFDQLEPSRPYSTRASMIEELYYISLPILNELQVDESRDWRVSALALEAIALQAEELREGFRPELMDALYPVLQLLASSNTDLQRHAMACLNILTQACGYPDTSAMIIENVDYLVNSVALKLNTFDVSPYPPQVLLMMVKLCGARLVPYLDDLVDSIFGIIDLYHGYPRLVELMFKTLTAIVGESTKNPALLAIENGSNGAAPDHLKKKYQALSIATLADDFARRKAKRAEYSDLTEEDEKLTHPKRPWGEDTETKAEDKTSGSDPLSELMGEDESDEPLPPPKEPEDAEKPPSKSHSLLLHIVQSLPLHLSSPSPYLRRSLLAILIDVLPVLAADEKNFLPLINDLWPAVVSKISFPSSLGTTSSTALMGKETPTSSTQNRGTTDSDFKEETFVTTTACQAVEVIFRTAGDFTASRVEAEFPRWERFYNRAWEKVRQDTDKILERQAQRQLPPSDTTTTGVIEKASSAFIQSLSLTKPGSASGSRAFTPHHTLWRAFTSLFLTLLTHVRLPLSVGDRICYILGEWIARYAGPTYYFLHQSSTPKSASISTSTSTSTTTHSEEDESIQNVIQAMETWNPDLTWFIFQQQRGEILRVMEKKGRVQRRSCLAPQVPLRSFAGGRIKFAEMSF
ncbi:armadillo-type protein [Aspergillus pseudodeflectus]|uniref:Armadillo-type protein n=1 Tax=Aspergillus pseudodeflectus TaxID=176178 RepID=A0ABR4JTX2_9EURO